MDPQKKGDMTEALALRALNELANWYPHFVRSVRRSSPELDARGIDCLVEIALPPGSGKPFMTVPIEFKSSSWGVEKWKVVHSDLHRAGVLIFELQHSTSPRNRRRLMYRALQKVQLNSRGGRLYHGMFQRVFRGGSKNLQANVDRIKEKRAGTSDRTKE